MQQMEVSKCRGLGRQESMKTIHKSARMGEWRNLELRCCPMLARLLSMLSRDYAFMQGEKRVFRAASIFMVILVPK